MRQLMLIFILTSNLHGEVQTTQDGDIVNVKSPLYNAVYSVYDRSPRTVEFTAYSEHIIRPIPRNFRRQFYTNNPELTIEDDDYRGAYIDGEQIQRGHILPHLLYGGSEDRHDIDNYLVIVPEFRTTNLCISKLEDYIANKVTAYKYMYITVTVGPGYNVKFRNADEVCLLPSYIQYELRYREQEDVDELIYEKYVIPNKPNTNIDFLQFKVVNNDN